MNLHVRSALQAGNEQWVALPEQLHICLTFGFPVPLDFASPSTINSRKAVPGSPGGDTNPSPARRYQ